VTQASPWNDNQWHLMRNHIWYNAWGVGLLSLLAVAGLARAGTGRPPAYWPMLAVLLVGVVLLGLGARSGGEGVYRYGTAIVTDSRSPTPAPSGETATPARLTVQEATPESPGGNSASRGITEILAKVPPLQVHLLLAGLVIAAALAALGLTVR